jgi:DNA anti-recombination protein RmuC
MSASEQLYKLADRAKQSEEKVAQAKEKTQADLRSQVQAARQSSQEHAAKLKSDVTDTKTKTSAWWSDVQKGWSDHVDKIRENVDDTMAEHDVDRAERRAEDAEGDAEAAVDFAYAALEEAEYAVLDAALARGDAEELAATV